MSLPDNERNWNKVTPETAIYYVMWHDIIVIIGSSNLILQKSGVHSK